MKVFAIICITGLLSIPAVRAGEPPTLPDGLYAVWESNYGNMTGELFHAESPIAVANFVGLAEGTHLWVDEETGRLRNNPYYDGHNVFRVAELGTSADSTIIQTGSQNGTNGGGGPGYRFQDEFDPSLRHDRFGIVSMANSGRHTNGTQYFFNRGPNPHLNDVHTIFGRIVGGGSVLDAIAAIPRTGTVPNDEVIFSKVYILRIGEEASDYDATETAPVVEPVDIVITQPTSTVSEVAFSLVYDQTTNTIYESMIGDDFDSMIRLSAELVRTNTQPKTVEIVDDNDTNATQFVSMHRIRHPRMYTPPDYPGLHFNATDDSLEITFSLDGSRGSVSVNNGAFNGTITQVTYSPSLYSAELAIDYSGFTPPRMVLQFDFPKPGTNGFFGTVFHSPGNDAFNIQGDFTYYKALVTPDVVLVTNLNNTADSEPNGLGGNSGAVAVNYTIGKYEITNAEYTHFLNAVDPEGLNDLALYNENMGTDIINGGITFTNANVEGTKYEVKAGFADKPVVYTSFYDAMRFCNWMHNGPRAGSDTEDGAYTLLPPLGSITRKPANGLTVERNANAKYRVPTENEWYKAAYHEPGGDADDYWLYPTGSNDAPDWRSPPGTSPAANFNGGAGNADALTDVGAYDTTEGFYGTFDMAGNASEWLETINGSARVVRGGSWRGAGSALLSNAVFSLDPGLETDNIGFRIARP